MRVKVTGGLHKLNMVLGLGFGVYDDTSFKVKA